MEVREKEKLTRYVFADDLNPLAELAGKAGQDDEKGKDGLGKSAGKGDKSAQSAGGGEEKGAPAWKDKEHAPWQDAYAYSLVNGLRLARFRVPGDGKAPKDALYYHYDALGSVVAASDRSGEAAGFLRYDAWGRPQVQGHLEKQPYAFTGKPWDRESDLYYFGARYYDPQAGRFISKDPFAGLLELPATQNPYPYVLNNPSTYVDPDGRFVWLLPVLWAVVETGLSLYDAYTTADVLLDPCASAADKSLSASLFLLGIVAPGGGYGLVDDAARSVWRLGPFPRGRLIEARLGANLPWNYPVIDRFANGVATSIKSIDLKAVTYQNPANLERTLKGYVDKLAGFRGRNWAGRNIEEWEIQQRELLVAIPPGPLSSGQAEAIQSAAQYAKDLGITFKTVVMP